MSFWWGAVGFSSILGSVVKLVTKLDVYGPSLHSINIHIIIYGGFIYKVLSITYSRLLKGTYINYNTIEFLRGIAFYSDICK